MPPVQVRVCAEEKNVVGTKIIIPGETIVSSPGIIIFYTTFADPAKTVDANCFTVALPRK